MKFLQRIINIYQQETIVQLSVLTYRHWSVLNLPKLFPYSRLFLSMDQKSGPIQTAIELKLKSNFNPLHLEVVNESYKHAVPKGSESHFKIVVVSKNFEGQSLIKRHRSVNAVLAEELNQFIHALSIQAKTPQQWEDSGHVVANTPPCLGGSKADQK